MTSAKQLTGLLLIALSALVLQRCCGDVFCLEEYPQEGGLRVEISTGSDNPTVPVIIFTGKEWEYGDTVWHGMLSSTFDTMVTTDASYSAKAIYHHKGEKVVVVDQAKVKVREPNCEETCYKINEGKLNLELRPKAE